MRNVALCLITLASLLHTGLAHADCSRPRPAFQIPDGTAATDDELTKAKEALVKFDQQIGEYLRCLEGEASQKSVGKDAATRTKVASDYVGSYNAAADELAGLGACYNAQVQAAQAAKAEPAAAGAKPAAKKPANCATFIKEAGTRKTSSGETVLESGLVKEADGYTTELTDGAWSFTLVRDDRARRCGEVECLQRIVYIRNSSPRSLECKASITYEGTDVEKRATVEGKAVVSGKTARSVLASLAARGVDAKTFDAQCNPRAELPPLQTPATCKYEVIKPITIGDYYPDASRKAGEEGPVTVEFNVGNKPANPTEVKVVASSLFPALDQGAVNAVQAMVMSSNCPTGRYRLRLSFQLQ
jgi:TonB family protein